MKPSSNYPFTEKLISDVRWLKVYAAAITLVLGVILLTGAKSDGPQPTTAELTVQRINIVDASGKPRLVISNPERFPPPVIDGVEYQRAISPAGLVFYDANGMESGGLGITDGEMGRMGALVFDYAKSDAIGLIARMTPDGNAIAGLQINSRPDPELGLIDAHKAAKRRVAVHNENENAEILLADAEGRTRIRLRVEENGNAVIEVLDESGNPTFRIPDAG